MHHGATYPLDMHILNIKEFRQCTMVTIFNCWRWVVFSFRYSICRLLALTVGQAVSSVAVHAVILQNSGPFTALEDSGAGHSHAEQKHQTSHDGLCKSECVSWLWCTSLNSQKAKVKVLLLWAWSLCLNFDLFVFWHGLISVISLMFRDKLRHKWISRGNSPWLGNY